MGALTISDANFKEKVLDIKGKPVLVDFWAPWCGPCQMQGPILEELVAEIGDKAVIGKVNVDDNQEAAGNYGIMSIPALMVFKDGEMVENMVGVHQKDDLLEIIARHS